MAIKTYSRRKDGGKKLSANFRVREFASKDGADGIKIDTRLVTLLQKIHDKFDSAVTITSGYRTKSHNKKVGGAANSYHTQGMAADIVVKGIDPLKVYLYADSIGLKGVIYYPGTKFCHIDTRPNKYRAISINKVCYPEPTSTLKQGSSGGSVKWMQLMLGYAGYKLTADGKFGAGTKLAVKDFQRKCGLTVDGIAGTKTIAKLKEVLM